MKKEILNQLKSDYDKLEIKPSADLWDRMELELNNKPVLSSKKSFEWMKYAAVVLLLISFGAVFYFSSNENFDKKNAIAVNKTGAIKNIKKTVRKIEIINSNINQPENNTISSTEISEEKRERKIEIIQYHPLQVTINQLIMNEEEKVAEINKNPEIQEVITQHTEKPAITEKKRSSYIKADDLLLGREFEKTREESRNHGRSFGVLDMDKIKIKSPNSFKILGMTVFSDSLDSK
ncbi:hypothetical protein [Chryseobacterium daeguense]|uniref:hypothetical protein n=1 Tax=Chryseobacterium daeguense TaxID=412438 RepID=UPI000405EF09|nr:hypothetical protein [Chryseobacterium daeguense]